MANAQAAMVPPREPAAGAALREPVVLATDALFRCFVGAALLKAAANAASIAARRAIGGTPARRSSRGSCPLCAPSRWCCSSTWGSCCCHGGFGLGAPRLIKMPSELVEGEGGMRPGARARYDVLPLLGPVSATIYCISVAFMAVGLTMRLLAQEKGSYMGRTGYMVYDIGCFVNAVIYCLIVVPRFVTNVKARYGRIALEF